MNPENPTPTLADDQAPTPLARRIGPPVALGSMLLTAVLLAWLAVAPTAIAGPIDEAPFTVPATLVVPPTEDGCMTIVAGDGSATEHCLDELARDQDDHYWVEATFAADGDVLVRRDGPERFVTFRIDPATGEVLERTEQSYDEFDRASREVPAGEDAPPPPGGTTDAPRSDVYTDGDVVRRFDTGDGPTRAEEDDPVVLDLDGPPGYWLRTAALSPDGDWVVVLTPDDLVAVAPTDGSAPPYVWAEVPDDLWVDLVAGIRWDS